MSYVPALQPTPEQGLVIDGTGCHELLGCQDLMPPDSRPIREQKNGVGFCWQSFQHLLPSGCIGCCMDVTPLGGLPTSGFPTHYAVEAYESCKVLTQPARARSI